MRFLLNLGLVAGALAAHDESRFKCDLPSPRDPSSDGLPAARDIFSSKEALLKQVERHAGIVQIPTISYDDSGKPGEDPRWDVFYTLHRAFERLYPTVHQRMAREFVNSLGLVYTITGTDPSLKPLMLAAHQDVVPVADAETWKYPPFSAHFDGRWLWGRGASDDKNSLTALMSALESLLANPNWIPKRTIILALGFDEESSGKMGAGHIGTFLEERYGPESMAMVLDEGGMGLQLLDKNTLYAMPAVMEKGHVDIWIELSLNGGHSSVPFPHTGIGIMAEIVNQVESHPWEPKVISGSPLHNHLICQARYSPKADPKLTKLVEKGDLKSLAKELVTMDRPTQYRLQTSQSVDYFNGGVKINAMPEYIKVGVNHRVAPHNSIPEVKANIIKQIQPMVKKFGLSVKAFEGEEMNPDNVELSLNELAAERQEEDSVFNPMYEVDYNGTITLSSSQRTEVAPISPTSGYIWDTLSGTIQHSFAFDKGTVVPVGELMTGNTDTRHYLNLSHHIYRFVPIRQGATVNAHTIDEGVDMQAHMEVLSFYYDLIRNFDALSVATPDQSEEYFENVEL